MAVEEERHFGVTTPLGEDVLLFQSMHGTEELGRPFEYRVNLASKREDVDFDRIVGDKLTVRVRLPGGGERYFNGHVSQFAQIGFAGGYVQYQATLVPWLWFLTRNADCRIFQDMKGPDIIKQVFRDRGFSDIEDSLSGSYRQWPYCVQYRETDFNFVNRLMEQEGIYYFFRHEADRHVLVLADSLGAHERCPGCEKLSFRPSGEQYRGDYVESWSIQRQVQPGNYMLDDYDFEKPTKNLRTRAAIQRQHAAADFEIYDYPGEYGEYGDGESYSRLRIEELQAQHELFTGETDAQGLAAGHLLELGEHPRSDQNGEYLMTGTSYDMAGGSLESGDAAGEPHYRCGFSAIRSTEAFRPPRVTPKPMIQGPQTAVVVGMSGEEIWTDDYGRVKVQFRWDRYGKSDENSSCWIRVAQVWAGSGLGGMHIPRIGQEVIVEFLEGDPDRPIVTGRVYNGENMPPYELAQNQTISTIKSRSTKNGDAETFNELRFEDKANEEEIYFHAERDFHRVVENDDVLEVGLDKKDKGDQSITIHNDRTRTVKEGNEKLQVEKGDREVLIDQGNDTHHIKRGNREVKIDTKDDILTVSQGNQSIKIVMGTSTIEAGMAIELKVGASSIKVEPAQITIASPQIAIQSAAMVNVAAPMTQVNGSGMLTLKGGMISIN